MKELILENQNYSAQQKIKNELDIVDFYNEATEDYEFWSKDFNMHFGYFDFLKTNPFNRDQMLNEMNQQVLKRLNLGNKKGLLLDFGCGMGGTIRYALQQKPKLSALGVTLSEFQVKEGNRLLSTLNGLILRQNYNRTTFGTGSADGVIAIESFCHSGHNISSFKEAYRTLKPGGKLVIADAFLKKEVDALCPGSSLAYRKLCEHWSLERLGGIQSVVQDLKKVGFKKVIAEDISFKVAPSVLHVPFAIIGFILKKLITGKPLKRESLHNLKGSFYALMSGLQMRSFGYYMISCVK